MQPTPDPARHLLELLDWLRRLLLWQVDVTRATYGDLADDEYRGLYVPRAEVDILGLGPQPLPEPLSALRAELAHERDQIEDLADALESQGVDLPLRRMARCFGLSRLEQDVLLLAMVPELDLRFERVIAYIQDDVSRRRPAVDLALRIFCPTPLAQIQAQAAFEGESPLIRQRLIQLVEEGARRPPLAARFLKIDDRIAAELRGGYAHAEIAIDPQVAGSARLITPRARAQALFFPDELCARLVQAVAGQMVIALQGSYGSGRQALAEATCAALGLPLLVVSLAPSTEADAPQAIQPAELCERLMREARLRGAAILWTGADRMLADDAPPAWRQALLAALERHEGGVFLALERSWEARNELQRRSYLRVTLPEISFSDRERVWQQRLGSDAPDEAVLQALASTFRLTAGQIRDAVGMARTLAAWRGEPLPSTADLFTACRAQSSGRLDALAHKIPANYQWDDIVLPSDQVTMLREICVQVRHRRTVLEAWGFDRHLAMGKGVNVLFAGQSGTGKTMAAEIIAADLGLELYKIDLSGMVSKYIGETEKNLDKVFTAAREANAILFFDEADALFGKRSEVKDAHDRYANIEVGYLLQKMEEYDGVVILATNLRKNLDDAFVRRLHVAIDFPFPEETDRLRIWRRVFPASAPLGADVDLAFLARQFKLAGGNIRNIALLAAYLSAEDGTAIGMAQIARAIKREYQKIGKMVTEGEFGPYLVHVREPGAAPRAVGRRPGSQAGEA